MTRAEFSQFVKLGKKIIGIGKNYKSKSQGLATNLDAPQVPIVFLKPTTSYITKGEIIKLPRTLGTVFYELELGLVFGRKGKNIPESQVLEYIAGYFLVLDMTAKEVVKGKVMGANPPWEIRKGWDTACPVGDFIPKQLIPDPNNVPLEAKLNGKVTQLGNTSDMIFSVHQLVSYVSKYMTLEPYDVLLTGTPDGAGAMEPGDVIEGRIGNLSHIKYKAEASSTN